MKPLFFLYVWLNLTRIAELHKENLVKHIRKITIQTGRLFFSSSLISCSLLVLQAGSLFLSRIVLFLPKIIHHKLL